MKERSRSMNAHPKSNAGNDAYIMTENSWKKRSFLPSFTEKRCWNSAKKNEVSNASMNNEKNVERNR